MTESQIEYRTNGVRFVAAVAVFCGFNNRVRLFSVFEKGEGNGMKWRDIARPIIALVIREVGMSDPKALRKALSDAYPFGEKAMHPYKIWLDEIARQTGRKKRKNCKAVRGQGELFT